MRFPFVLPAQHATLVVLALASVLGLAQHARATVMVEVPLESLVRDSDAIVVGVVEHVGVRLQIRGEHSEPHTITTLRVREWIKGSGDELVRIDEIGGVLPDGRGGLAIAGMPSYEVGEEVVLFLRGCAECGRGMLRTYAMEQGHFTIRRGVPGVDDLVSRDLSAIGFASWARGPMEVEHGGRSAMRLHDFLGYLRATVEQLRLDGAPGSVDPLRGGAR